MDHRNIDRVEDEDMEAVIFIGIQASGKSTFYRERFSDTHVRINLDMLKTRHREARLIETCVETGQGFVVDNTNPTRQDRARYVTRAKDAGFRIVGYYFQSKIGEAVARNNARPSARRVPEKGVRGTHARLELPNADEGFDALFYVRIDEPHGFVVEEWSDEV